MKENYLGTLISFWQYLFHSASYLHNCFGKTTLILYNMPWNLKFIHILPNPGWKWFVKASYRSLFLGSKFPNQYGYLCLLQSRYQGMYFFMSVILDTASHLFLHFGCLLKLYVSEREVWSSREKCLIITLLEFIQCLYRRPFQEVNVGFTFRLDFAYCLKTLLILPIGRYR